MVGIETAEMPSTEYRIQYPCGLSGKDVVGMGITALVARLDAVITVRAGYSGALFREGGMLSSYNMSAMGL